MPPVRPRATNPQGRQKSCSECAKAKRRCGLQQPSCARCTRQHLACAYPPQPGSEDTIWNDVTHVRNNNFDSTSTMADFENIGSTNLPFDFDVPTLPGSSVTGTLDFDLLAGANSLDSLSNIFGTSSDKTERLAVGRTTKQVMWPFSSATLSLFARSRAEYCFEQLSLAPKMMVEQNCTPWAHARLFEEYMPRSLQEAHASCALYVTRNATNRAVVFQHINSRIAELVTAYTPSNPVEVLARAHALMLYQVMLIFAGDVESYRQAMDLLPHTEEARDAIMLLAAEQEDSKGLLPYYPSSVARAAWRSYIFRESIRRTAMSIYQVTAMCSLLNGQLTSCDCSMIEGSRVTLSAHLWAAKSAFDFAVAWNDKNHFLIKRLDLTEVMRDANPDDLDLFAKIMFVSLQGIDDVRGWLHVRGAVI
ncbi:hypothetical protein T440DRAFT_391523 [Plenodomus tracheiphilus IPT5]|uniref:Zn(2)-C6 fungal-type domain-containing protein n=1 Tax=Plenodomus tracheiphilus IPT5 TaxID=1408161 RepID=A0A6A7BC37_9PLEO|nr:hypothetical protein T440DRAFT_391523 [Plenodomus tracheiphilus IPT5]